MVVADVRKTTRPSVRCTSQHNDSNPKKTEETKTWTRYQVDVNELPQKRSEKAKC